MRLYLTNSRDKKTNFNKCIQYENHLRLIPLEQFTLKQNEFGKPYILEDSCLQFNISHTRGMWICGFRDTYSIGVDIESNNLVNIRANSIAKRFFHKNELKLINNNLPMFPYIWTAKESFVKCIGEGINSNFSKLCVVDSNKLIGNHDEYYFYSLEIDNFQ